MKKSWFDDIGDEEEIHRISERLKLHVDDTFECELPVILRMGLKEAKTVLDIGTGNGYFLHLLAKKFPDKKFLGLQSNEVLLRTAKKDASSFKLPNISFQAACCPLQGHKDKYDLILIHMALYCMPERMEVLKWARGLLSPGGCICVAELDDGWNTVHPPDKRWDNFFSDIQQVIRKKGADPFIGHKIPALLHQSDFANIRVEMNDAYSSWAMGRDAFCNYFQNTARLVNIAWSDTANAEVFANFEKFLEDFRKDPNATAFVPMIVAGGQNS